MNAPETTVYFEPTALGKLRVFLHPIPLHLYLVSVDPSSGGELALADHKPGDDTAVCVRDRHTHEVVASMRGRFPPYSIKHLIYLLCRYYNNAMLVVENNAGWGAPILEYVYKEMGYTQLYMCEMATSLTGQTSTQMGWNTNSATRPLAMTTARGVLRDGKEKIHCKDTVNQLLRMQYVALPSGRAKEMAPSGEKDDAALAWVINIRVCYELGEPDPIPDGSALKRYVDPFTREVWSELFEAAEQERLAQLTDGFEF